MKIQCFVQVLFASTLLALVSSCATTSRSGPAALAGTWTNSSGTIWTMKADGTFDVDSNHDGTRDIMGTFTVVGDTITIQGTGGKIPKNCKGAGVYKFSQPDQNILFFTLVSDTCTARKKSMLQAWHRK